MEKLLNLYNRWCSIPDKIRFLLVGGVNAAVSYIIFAIALYLIGNEHYQICVALQWIISSVFSFFNQKSICILYKRSLAKRIFQMLHNMGCQLCLQRNNFRINSKIYL